MEKNPEHSALLNINLEQTTGFLLLRVANRWERKIEEAVANLDLTKTQFFILSITHFLNQKQGAVTQSLLAQYSGMDLMMISQVARRLENKQFLCRAPHPTDSRAKVLTLTETGTKTMLEARKQVMTAWQTFIKDLPETDKQLKPLLEQLYWQA